MGGNSISTLLILENWHKQVYLPVCASFREKREKAVNSLLKQGLVVLLAIFAGVSLPAVANEQMFSFDVPKTTVDKALNTIALQAGAQVLFPFDKVRSIEANTVSGELTLTEALKLTLNGTGLMANFTPSGVITVSFSSEQSKLNGEGRTPMKKEQKLSLLSKVALMIFGAANIQGISAQEGNAREEEKVVEEVVVTGTRGSIINALKRKKDSANVVDSIEAEDLGKFPDINLAESLQRIPGVALERSVTGSGRTLTVRGLSSQFTRVEINGMGGATGGGGRSSRIDSATRSAGQDGRNFNFDILPTELFSSAVVSKSPTASDTEGGIAALIQLNSPAPFDLDEVAATASGQGNWGEDGSVQPRFSGLFSKQFSEQFAVFIGGVYAKNESVTAQVGFDRLVPFSTITNNAAGATQAQLDALVPRGAAYIARQRETENISGILTAQWRPTDRIDVRFDAILTDSSGTEVEAENFIDLTTGVPLPTALNITNGVAISGSFASFRRAQAQFRHDVIDDQLQQFTLQGSFQINDIWSVEPFIGYNKREIKRPFNEVNYFASGAADSVMYSLTGGVDDFSTTLSDFSSNPQAFVLSNVLRATNNSESDEFDAKFDIVGEFDHAVKNFRAGISYRERDSSVDEPFRGGLNFNPVSPTLADLGSTQEFGIGGNAPSSIFSLDVLSAVSTLLGGQDLLDPNFDITTTQLAGIVIGNNDGDTLAAAQVGEDVLAGYAEVDIEFNKIWINAGVRIVETDQTSTGAASINGIVVPIAVNNKYTEWLPSVNVRYEAIQDLFLRGTYSKALSRPSLQALSPRETINFNTLTGTRGNPELDPFTVDQFDLGAEWYFEEEGLLGFTYFEKDFSSLVGQETVILQRNQASTGGGTALQPVTFNQPLNTGTGKVKDFELSAQSSLFFLPGEFKNPGVIFNFTDLSSSTTVTTAAGAQALPFPNLSPSSLNAAVYYDNGQFDTRLGYTWREGFLQDGLDPDGNFFRQEDFDSLDLTMNYEWGDKITIQLQASNLLDEELEFASSSQQVKVRRLDLERRIVFGVRYEFL